MLRDKEYAERPNKTQLKLVEQHHHNLGKQLVELANSKFEKLPISEHLRAAVLEGRRFQKGALKRQLKFIAGLMKEENIDAIELELKRQNLPDKQEVELFHQLEQWRDGLISGDKQLTNALYQRFGTIDRQHLNQLIRNAAKEAKQNKPPKSSRALFQYLKELQEAS